MLIAFNANRASNRAKVATSGDPDRAVYRAQLHSHLDALRNELDRRWVAKAEGVPMPVTTDRTENASSDGCRAHQPHAERISQLFVERAKVMGQWGVLYWTIGPAHTETLKRETQINNLAAAILRLQQVGS